MSDLMELLYSYNGPQRVAVRGNDVYIGGMLAYLCGSRARARAVARDIKAGAAVVAFSMPRPKYL